MPENRQPFADQAYDGIDEAMLRALVGDPLQCLGQRLVYTVGEFVHTTGVESLPQPEACCPPLLMNTCRHS